ncbi:MAG: hypothetical protein OFPI_18650 [Osedax symbiont Rs2]|nr:MAG: hypothetical protein OFPI_18650 [Osedax symbiont Rs2]
MTVAKLLKLVTPITIDKPDVMKTIISRTIKIICRLIPI